MKNIALFALVSMMILLIPTSMATGIKIPEIFSTLIVLIIVTLSLFGRKNDMMQVLIMLVFLVIIHKVLIYRTYIATLFALEIGIIFVTASYFKNLVTARIKLKINNGLIVFIIAIVTFGVISSSVAIISGSDMGNELISLQVYIFWAVIFLLYGVQIRQLPRFSQVNLERAFAIICIAVAFLHIFAIFTDTSIELVRDDASVGKRDAATQFRYGGVFGNPNIQSAFLVGGMSYCMFLYVRLLSTPDKVLAAVGFVLSLSSAAMSGSRMALLSSGVLIVLFVIYQRKKLGHLLHFMLGMSIIIGIIAFLKRGAFINHINKTLRRIEGKSDDDIRYIIWDCSRDLIPDNLLGMGISYEKYMNDIYDCLGGDLGNPHNIFFDFAIHLGVAGIIIFIICALIISVIMVKKLMRTKYEDNDANIFFLFMILLFGFSEAFVFSLHKLHLIIFFVIGITFGAKKGSVEDEKIETSNREQNRKKITYQLNTFDVRNIHNQ